MPAVCGHSLPMNRVRQQENIGPLSMKPMILQMKPQQETRMQECAPMP